MNRNLKLVSSSLFMWGIGEGMFLLFQPLYLLEFGADPITVGLILGAMGFMTTISQIPSGYLSDRFSPRPLMWASWIFGMISAWLMALAGSLPLFIIALLMYGFTGSALAPMNAYITSMRGKWTAERSLTFTSASFHLGAVIGPTLGGYLGQQFNLRLLYFIAAIFFVISTLLILFIEKPKIEIHHDFHPGKSIFKNIYFRQIVVIGFFALFFMVFTQNFSSIYLTSNKFINLQQIGYLGTIGSVGNVVLALTFGHLRSFTGYLISIPFTIMYSIILPNANNFASFSLAYFSFGGYRLARSMLLALSREFIHSRETALAYGVIETANGLAIILAPPLCGIVYNKNPDAVFWISTIGLTIIGIVIFFHLSKIKGKRTDWL